ncbi:unnamed protein product [Allacma fusca]|uniref:Uncharacterized protein n=1 Tax=Allacma fusca TaxID=39272 RepID=A0A8J2K2A2_9HEXA|nr:unnamed protein product [Allacma fusca]
MGFSSVQLIGLTLLGLSALVFTASLPSTTTDNQETSTVEESLKKNCTDLYIQCIENIDQGEVYVEVCNNTLKCIAGYFDCMSIPYSHDEIALSDMPTLLPY